MFSSRTRSLVKQTLQRQAKLIGAVTRTGSQNYSVLTALARSGSQSQQKAGSAFKVSRFLSAGRDLETDLEDYEEEIDFDSDEYGSDYTSDEYGSDEYGSDEYDSNDEDSDAYDSNEQPKAPPKQIRPSTIIDEEAGIIYKSVFPYKQEWERYDGELGLNRTYSRFDQPIVSDTYTHGMTGSYVLVSDEELALLPEGLAGELNEEFEVSVRDEQKRWMIRDSTKLLCQLLDQHKHPDGPKTARHNYDHVEFPGLTDRPEWIDAVMRVDCHGHTLLDVPKNSKKASGSRSVDPIAETDVVSMVLESLAQATPQLCEGKVPKQVLLTGPRGVGKSVALTQAVLHARRNGWLVLYIPRGWDQSQLGSYVQPALLERSARRNAGAQLGFKVTTLVEDEEALADLPPPVPEPTTEETIFDNHEMSAEALRGFLRAHGPQLRKIPLRSPKTLDKYRDYLEDFTEAFNRIKPVMREWRTMSFIEIRRALQGDDNVPQLDELDADVLREFAFSEFECKTLEDVALLGVAFRELSGSLFIDLVNELKELNDPNMPVLFAVDQYNAWEVDSAYSYDGRKIPAKHLCVPYALNFLSTKKADAANWSMKNGFCIAATSMRPSESRKITYAQNKPSIPLAITVPHYSASEFLAATSYLTFQGHLLPHLELRDLLALRTYTSSNPRLVREQSQSYLLPRMLELGEEDSERHDAASLALQDDGDASDGSDDDEEHGSDEDWDGQGEPPSDDDAEIDAAYLEDADEGYYDAIMPDGQVKMGKASLELLAADKAKRAKKAGKKGRK